MQTENTTTFINQWKFINTLKDKNLCVKKRTVKKHSEIKKNKNNKKRSELMSVNNVRTILNKLFFKREIDLNKKNYCKFKIIKISNDLGITKSQLLYFIDLKNHANKNYIKYIRFKIHAKVIELYLKSKYNDKIMLDKYDVKIPN